MSKKERKKRKRENGGDQCIFGNAGANAPTLAFDHALAVSFRLFSCPQYARRTALTRAKKGLWKDTSSDALIYKTLHAGLKESGVAPELVQDIVVGEWGGAALNQHERVRSHLPP
jgi:hypothetical protein